MANFYEEYDRSDYLGLGSYQCIGQPGKPKNQTQIGFVRQKQKVKPPIRKQPQLKIKNARR